jgi:Ribbon-helix-helix protein, copG family
MRTTVRLDEDLLAAAKQRAAAEHTTLTALIEDSLRRTLALRPATQEQHLEICQLGDATTLAGVDLDDASALRDLMDGLR